MALQMFRSPMRRSLRHHNYRLYLSGQLQSLSIDSMRGRVMSVFSMMLVGMAPFGSLLSGALADLIGASATVIINGCFCVVGGMLFGARLPHLRQAARADFSR
jgi:hypothetical protein